MDLVLYASSDATPHGLQTLCAHLHHSPSDTGILYFEWAAALNNMLPQAAAVQLL